jgi:hypothetical protein
LIFFASFPRITSSILSGGASGPISISTRMTSAFAPP